MEQIGIVGLGRMGANLALQAIDKGLRVIAFTQDQPGEALRQAQVVMN